MSRWFRVYETMVDDPKMQRLSAELFRLTVNLWCIASKNGGRLPSLGDMAFTLRLRTDRLQKMLNELKACELIDGDEVMEPHNWNKRQYKSDVTDPTAADRQQRCRDKRRNADRNEDRNATVQHKRPETETETETDTEQSRTEQKKSPKRVRAMYSEDFENRFWKPYPRTPVMAKKEAWREWEKLDPEQQVAACAAIPGYLSFLKANPTHSIVHACRFLSEQRWEGFAPEAPTEKVRVDMAARGWEWRENRWQKTGEPNAAA